MGNYGIKVSMKGKDIDSVDPADYALWSKYPNLKYLTQVDNWPTAITVPASTFYDDYTITHNLGYHPHRSMYFRDRDGKWFRIPAIATDGVKFPTGSSGSASRAVTVAEDTNSITIRIGSTYSGNPAIEYQLGNHIFADQDKS